MALLVPPLLRLLLVPPEHESVGCFDDVAVPLVFMMIVRCSDLLTASSCRRALPFLTIAVVPMKCLQDKNQEAEALDADMGRSRSLLAMGLLCRSFTAAAGKSKMHATIDRVAPNRFMRLLARGTLYLIQKLNLRQNVRATRWTVPRPTNSCHKAHI